VNLVNSMVFIINCLHFQLSPPPPKRLVSAKSRVVTTKSAPTSASNVPPLTLDDIIKMQCQAAQTQPSTEDKAYIDVNDFHVKNLTVQVSKNIFLE